LGGTQQWVLREEAGQRECHRKWTYHPEQHSIVGAWRRPGSGPEMQNHLAGIRAVLHPSNKEQSGTTDF
jgi:hypothetical protein